MYVRKQKGQIVRISGRWYVRYWEKRNVDGAIEQKRVSYCLGSITTRGKHPPADIVDEAEKHMSTINRGAIPPERIMTIGDFVDGVYLPWITQHKRPSTAKAYRIIWEEHFKPLCAGSWLKETRTYHVQSWLDSISKKSLGRNTLKHIKSVISAIFTLAKQQDFFQGENPSRETAIDPHAKEPEETYAYSLEEIQQILSLLPEPAATAFAVAAFMGLRHGEIQGLLWENYRNGEVFVSRSIWNGKVTDPKTRKSSAAVPVIRQLADRLEMHRLRCGNPESGPIFRNTAGKPLSLVNLSNRAIYPTLNRCAQCGKAEADHKETHEYKRDERYPEWHGWHAARRGLGSNLYRLGVNDKVIQAILRHANVSTTTTYYIKTITDDVRDAMDKLEKSIPESELDTFRTLKPASNSRM